MLVVIWLMFAVACGGVAADKGRSVPGWVILGLLGGFISLIVLACLSSEVVTPNQAALAAGGPRAVLPEKTCPKCAESVKQAAQVCRFCGHDFSTETPRPIQTKMQKIS